MKGTPEEVIGATMQAGDATAAALLVTTVEMERAADQVGSWDEPMSLFSITRTVGEEHLILETNEITSLPNAQPGMAAQFMRAAGAMIHLGILDVGPTDRVVALTVMYEGWLVEVTDRDEGHMLGPIEENPGRRESRVVITVDRTLSAITVIHERDGETQVWTAEDSTPFNLQDALRDLVAVLPV